MQHSSFPFPALITRQCGFHSPNASGWTNVLTLAQLLFSLPVSNGKLERVFSTMKLIKAEKRSSMSNETLDDLLAINIDGVSVES